MHWKTRTYFVSFWMYPKMLPQLSPAPSQKSPLRKTQMCSGWKTILRTSFWTHFFQRSCAMTHSPYSSFSVLMFCLLFLPFPSYQ